MDAEVDEGSSKDEGVDELDEPQQPGEAAEDRALRLHLGDELSPGAPSLVWLLLHRRKMELDAVGRQSTDSLSHRVARESTAPRWARLLPDEQRALANVASGGYSGAMELNVEEVDLAAVATALQRSFEGCPPSGYVRGRTMLRDAVAAQLRCSEAEAERLVETMVGRGFLRFEGDPGKADENAASWTIGAAR